MEARVGVTLKEFVAALEEEGVVGEEAEEAVEQFLSLRKRGGGAEPSALAKRPAHEIDFPHSPMEQRGIRSVDYGDETPEEAEERWIEQEMEDPDGVFAGGATGGGIFGDAPIATRTYDPGARRRTVDLDNARASALEKRVTVKVLTKIAEKLGCDLEDIGELASGSAPRRQLPGRKRRRR